MASVNYTVKLDRENKSQAEQILKQLGLNLSSAINIYINAIVREQKIPFELSLKKEVDFERYLIFKNFDEQMKISEAEASDPNVKKYSLDEIMDSIDERIGDNE